MRINLNNSWFFSKKGQSAVEVNLPHDAMLTEQRDGACHNGVNSGYFPGGTYTYEKELELTRENLGSSMVLHFEGVYQNCKIYLNEKMVGSHRYGYTAFDVDVSKDLCEGKHKLRVEVDNSLEPNCRWYSGSGIYRPVWLAVDELVAPRIITKSYEPAVIEIQAEAGTKVSIYEGTAMVAEGDVNQTSIQLTVPNAKLWTAETPYLYSCKAEKDGKTIQMEFGIRLLEWDAKKGFCVNGERILLRGGCIHHDHGVVGACDFRTAEERRIALLKKCGFNAIRMAHNPATQITLEVCDRLGMYVMNETFDGWYVPKTYHDYARWFEQDWKEDITAMVKSAWNHPSVIMYSTGNEVSETATEKGVKVCKMLTDYIHTLDDTRPVTAGVNVLLNVYTNMGIGVYKDKGDYKPEPLPQKKGYKEKKTGSAFFNAMAEKLGRLMFFMAAGKKGDRASKGAADGLDIIGLNYAASRYEEDAKNYPDRMMVGSETMAADLPYNWERVKKYPQVIGDFVWSAWDYLGEACIGDWTYYSYKGLPLLAGQGMIDITGKPLAAMYFMQVVWGFRKEPFIGVRPLNHVGEKPSTGAWQFTNAIDSWTWHGYEGVKAVVEVYAAADSVRLELNGKEISTQKVKKYKTLFKVPYEAGKLEAIALDEQGIEISRHHLQTGNKEKKLTVKPEKMVLKSDGQDLCYIPIEFTDESGNLHPYVEQPVMVEAEGAGVLQGLGSALCKTDERYDSNTFHSYRGRLLAVLRSGNETGEIHMKVTSVGVEPVELVISVK